MDSSGEQRKRLLVAGLGIPLVIVLLGIPAAYYARYRWRDVQFERMGDEAEVLGGHCNITWRVSYFWGIAIHHENCIEEIQLANAAVTDADLLRWPIKGADELSEIDLTATRITDAGLDAFQGLQCVKDLKLSHTAITGKGLGVVQTLNGLENLNLEGTRLQSQNLQSLRLMISLKSLNLSNTRVDGLGLAHLANLTQLERLYLENTNIKDSDLVHLANLRKLRELWLEGTQVTVAGMQSLSRKLPRCAVLIDEKQ